MLRLQSFSVANADVEGSSLGGRVVIFLPRPGPCHVLFLGLPVGRGSRLAWRLLARLPARESEFASPRNRRCRSDGGICSTNYARRGRARRVYRLDVCGVLRGRKRVRLESMEKHKEV